MGLDIKKESKNTKHAQKGLPPAQIYTQVVSRTH